MIGVKLEFGPEFGNGFLCLTARQQGVAEEIVKFGRLWGQRQGSLIMTDRVLEIAFQGEDETKVSLGRGVTRFEFQRLSKMFGCFSKVLFSNQCRAQV